MNTLVAHTETEVFEAYLQARWTELPQLGPPPNGEHAIALMRLVVQVQQAPLQQKLAAAYSQLGAEDRMTLANEMAVTGIKGQHYQRTVGSSSTAISNTVSAGPAFLVYYSPAFLRTAARSDCLQGLRMLAEVYRVARSLWPLSTSKADETVTLRVDQMKERSPERIIEGHQWGECWMLVKRNELEGVIEMTQMYSFNDDTNKGERRLLCFWRTDDEDDDEDGTAVRELERMRQRMTKSGLS